MKCPKCGNTEEFIIRGWCISSETWLIRSQGDDFDILDVDDTLGDNYRVYPAGDANCEECGHEAKIEEFGCRFAMGEPALRKEVPVGN